MESSFILTATDKQAKTLFDSELATVKLMEFMGDANKYPKANLKSKVVHPWRVLLRHRDEIGPIDEVKSFNQVMNILNKYSHE